jgi:SAM-dependent methyltransferase
MSGVDFTRNAAVYDDRHGAAIDAALAARLIDEAGLARGSTALDVGAGTGRVAVPLAAHGCRVVAVDLAAAMLERLRAKADTAGGQPDARRRVLAAVASAGALPFRAEVFDAVIVARVLYLVEEWRGALDEAARVLRRGGVLLHEWGNGDADEPWVEVREKARELFERAGVAAPFHPGARSEADVDRHLSARGFVRGSTLSWPSGAATTIGRFLDRIESGECSYTWSVPDAAQRACLPALRAWAEARFGRDFAFAAPRAISWTIHAASKLPTAIR